MLPQRLPDKALWWIWGGALPTILDAIVDALPEGGASPIAPETAITIGDIVDPIEEASFEEAATALGITVEELLSLPKQLVIGKSNIVVTRSYYQNIDDKYYDARFGTAGYGFEFIIDYDTRLVSVQSF